MLIKKEFKNIPLDELESMTDYQRPLNQAFIEEKSKPGVFDPNAVDAPKISVRNDGTRKMGDGQHTVGIVRNVGWKSIRCELRYGLTEQEENDWFAQINTKSQPQSHKRILTAQIRGTYEKNKDEQDFYNCLKSIGYKLDIYGEEAGSDYKINCSASLFNLYKEYLKSNKKDKFIECMDIIKTSFMGESTSLQWCFIRGMFDFYETYNDKIDRKRLVEVLSRENVRDLKRDAESDIRTKKTSTKYAKLFVEKYNYKLSKNKQLKMSKLDD
jgi:hypothetical protein